MLRNRAFLGVTVLLAAAAISCLVSLTQALLLGADYRSAAAAADYEHCRLSDIRPLLPPFTRLEYLPDEPPGEKRGALVGYLTQYTLAPVLLSIDGPRQSRLLLDGRPGVAPNLDSKRQPILEYDAGNGVRLYRVLEP